MARAQRLFQGQCGNGNPMPGSFAGHFHMGVRARLESLEEWKALVSCESL